MSTVVITAQAQWSDPINVLTARGGKIGLIVGGDLSNGSTVTVQVRGQDNSGAWGAWLAYSTVTHTTVAKSDEADVTRGMNSTAGVVPIAVDWMGPFQVRAGVDTGDFSASDTPTIWW